MSYQVLARKWRPRTFHDMVGQEPILRILANALLQQRLHHAYLFTGTRGVGKTTIARILAKCLNCETGITPTPCGTCYTCKTIDAGQFLDLYEIDAASRTKVEDTRELLENVPYPPTQGRYKIYLIDEVHMLSNHSFNALLKTLEEPPTHVIFLLATTEPKRLPITILSRCLQFHLKRITVEQIAKHLQHICDAEKINYEASALGKIAHAADGSMRDALSLLDQAIAYGSGTVNQADINSMLGSLSHEDLLPMIEALANQNGAEVFQLCKSLSERAPDFQQVLEELISIFHRIAIAQIVPNAAGNDEHINTFAKRFSSEDVQLYYQIALLGRRDLAHSPVPQSGFEMTLLRMLAFNPVISKTTVEPVQIQSKPVPKVEKKPAAIAINTTNLPDWREVLPKLELSGMAYALASNCTLQEIKENKVTLALSAAHQPMLSPKLKERIEEALTRHMQKPIQLDIATTTQELLTPHKMQEHEQNERLTSAKQSIMQDPKVKQLIDMYDATVEITLAT